MVVPLSCPVPLQRMPAIQFQKHSSVIPSSLHLFRTLQVFPRSPKYTYVSVPNSSRKQFIPKHLLQQPTEQSRQLHRDETIHSSWRKHPRLRSIQREFTICSQWHNKPFQSRRLSYNRLHWTLIFRVLQHMARYKIQPRLQFGARWKQFSWMGDLD
jgi:hypothetical protein